MGVTPFTEPNADLVIAVERAGGLGVLDLGREEQTARRELARVRLRWKGSFGVRIPAGCPLAPGDLPDQAGTVLLDPVTCPDPWRGPWPAAGRRILAEVTSPAEARQALRHGAHGLVARGTEGAGRVGELSTFILLQRLLDELDVPVWAAGGIGPHTAAAAIAGGARGVLLDGQLALVAEVRPTLPAEVAAALAAMDGSETAVVAGHRVYTRPDLRASPPPTGGFGARDLRRQQLPVGQDGAFAAPLADRHKTAGGVVLAVRAAIAEHLGAAVASPPLAAGAGIAGRDAALRLPVAQGPMTRVSDRAEFAMAVADAGGLPFLALALMSGAETTALLAETSALLGERPWGVGILGFSPPDVREAQLAAVHSVRPPYALIAGGRPAQAAPLEAAGVSAFLHVPSPGLLDRFLKEGARKFVLEGSECGGHIGPRASFPLWESQIERLLSFGAAHPGALADVHVLFAGGIHDERSAAMVAAMCGPLAERGVATGVLMGTAYLLTREAVDSGAILPGYQRTVLECERTAMLETSPGHVTRCADTPYVATFENARRRLVEGGATPQETWADLEQFNLGRLRIAAKGLRRTDDGLTQVGEDEQRRDGMYMLGEVATARSHLTDLATLHEQVTAGATGFLAATAAGRAAAPAQGAAPLDIAVVGMACVYPGADGLETYWSNILAGADAVTEVPKERWDPALYYEPDAAADQQGRTPSKWGGFLPPVPFDPLAYGIPPASLAGIEPAQLLALEVAARALRDAGYDERPFNRELTSVIFGAEAGSDLSASYGLRSALPAYTGGIPAELDEHLPKLTEDSFPGVLSNVIAGRIANRLDLGGANYTVDAACASSLAALDLACKELTAGTSEMVLCGAADLHNGIHDYLMFASAQALSPTGRCATFDSAADGIALGEGVACVVLKRLADAERDGDRVYAVVQGVAGSSDGRALGLTAPRPEGQRRAIERCYAMAGISPADVGLVEAHGTGTVVGDRTELATLTELFTAAGATPGSCTIGSVKSQIGHTKCAAGLAGLIKVAYALHAGVRPGTLHVSEPNAYWSADTSPFSFGGGPWAVPPGLRHAAVSAFGFGGTNFHAVLTGYDGADEPAHGRTEWPAELFVFRGPDRATALAEAARLVRTGHSTPLRELAAAPGGAGPVQLAIVATDLDDLRAKLRDPKPGEGVHLAADPAAEDQKVAFLFPGQGSQRPGMLADLFIAFPRLQRLLRQGGGRYAPLMFPPSAFTPADVARHRAAITATEVAQPALGIAGLAVTELLGSLGVHPDLAGGHSYGELVALCAAGAFAEADLLALSEARAAAILAATGDGDPGAMAAVSASVTELSEALDGIGDVVLANHNAPAQLVISGPTGAIEAAVEALTERGVTARRIPVACAFHSPVVARGADTFATNLAAHRFRRPAFPVWSNTTAAPYPDDPARLRPTLAGQIAEPVRFTEQIESMYAAGARVFVEAGPGRVLTGLVAKILGDRPHTAVACDVPGDDGIVRLLNTVAELAVAGVPVDLAPLFAGRADPVTEPPAARSPGWTVNGHLVRTVAGDPVPGGLRPATDLPAPAPVAGPSRDAVVTEFLRTTRELVGAQRDVLLSYLGTSPGSSPPQTVSNDSVPAHPQIRTGSPSVRATSAPPAPEPPAPITRGEIAEVVLATVGARTGYPLDMLGADLDLEADLSIDSIKRTEIIGELAERLRLNGAGTTVDEQIVERLARIKTIGAIADWLTEHVATTPGNGEAATSQPSRADAVTAAGPDERAASQPVIRLRPSDQPEAAGAVTVAGPPGDTPGGAADAAPRSGTPGRYLVEVVSAPPAEAGPGVDGRRLVIVDDGRGIALELSDLLERRGAEVRTVQTATEEILAGADGLIHLEALRPATGPILPGAFTQVRAALAGGVGHLIVATASAGTFGRGRPDDDPSDGDPADAGLRGMIRTIAREFPDVVARAVDVDPKESPRAVAEQLLAELTGGDGTPVVGYPNGTRSVLRLRRVELPKAPASAPVPRVPGLGRDGVVLLTGGARGVTGIFAVALARATGCHIELIGRSRLPGGHEHAATARAGDPGALRRALIESGMGRPAEIEAGVRRILVDREMRGTLDRLREAAASVRYHVADVRDADGILAVIDDVYARHGRLDGVVHGAGLLEDRLTLEKSPESFDRVYGTKVDGFRSLVAALDPPGPQGTGTPRRDVGFLVLFGSVSGVFGNRGQVDYAAANDALDTLSHTWSGRLPGRVLTVDWGPWAGGGMVSPELEREYARRGVTLIDPQAGAGCLLRELADGGDAAQVVYMCGEDGLDG